MMQQQKDLQKQLEQMKDKFTKHNVEKQNEFKELSESVSRETKATRRTSSTTTMNEEMKKLFEKLEKDDG